MDWRRDGTVRTLFGSCGWTTDPLNKNHNFIPSSARTAVERLRHYSRYLPQVEIDTSNYAIPRRRQLTEWASVTPEGFIFHIKALGLFPSGSCDPGSLPRDLRAQHLTPEEESRPRVALRDLPPEMVDALWERFNGAVQILHDRGKLGCIVFQYHADFGPSAPHLEHIAYCRERLSPHFLMAVEFRQRAWYDARETYPTNEGGQPILADVVAFPEEGYARVERSLAAAAARIAAAAAEAAADSGQSDDEAGDSGNVQQGRSASAAGSSKASNPRSSHLEAEDGATPSQSAVGIGDAAKPAAAASQPQTAQTPAHGFVCQRDATLSFFRRLGIVNIASDDLADEYTPREAAGQPQERDGSGRLQIADYVTNPRCAYVRLHRRRGEDRVLPPSTVQDWVRRCNAWARETTDVSGSAEGTGSSSGIGSSGTPCALRGPIYFNVSTAAGDCTLANVRALSIEMRDEYERAILGPGNAAGSDGSAVAGTDEGPRVTEMTAYTSGVIATARALRPLPAALPAFALPVDWRAIARKADAKTGIGAYFQRKGTTSSDAGASVEGAGRASAPVVQHGAGALAASDPLRMRAGAFPAPVTSAGVKRPREAATPTEGGNSNSCAAGSPAGTGKTAPLSAFLSAGSGHAGSASGSKKKSAPPWQQSTTLFSFYGKK